MNDPIDDFYKLTDNQHKAVSGAWKNFGVSVDAEMQCPIHGDNAEGDCWPCHVAGVNADPSSCEPIEAEE